MVYPPPVRIGLSVPLGNDRGPLYLEQALAAIHQANPQRLPLTLELGRDGGRVGLSCRLPPELRSVVEGQLFAQYPDGAIEPLPNEDALPPGHRRWTVALRLRHGAPAPSAVSAP